MLLLEPKWRRETARLSLSTYGNRHRVLSPKNCIDTIYCNRANALPRLTSNHTVIINNGTVNRISISFKY
jgi:hypothetical protein